MRPFLLKDLHLAHIFLTDAQTLNINRDKSEFIKFIKSKVRKAQNVAKRHL